MNTAGHFKGDCQVGVTVEHDRGIRGDGQQIGVPVEHHGAFRSTNRWLGFRMNTTYAMQINESEVGVFG